LYIGSLIFELSGVAVTPKKKELLKNLKKVGRFMEELKTY